MKRFLILICVILLTGCCSKLNNRYEMADFDMLEQYSITQQNNDDEFEWQTDFVGNMQDFLLFAQNNQPNDKTGIMINASQIKPAYCVEINEIKYLISLQDGKCIYQRTDDKKFVTEKKLTINNTVEDFIKQYEENIYVEVGANFYIQIENNWRAVISFADKVDYSSKIKFFYKIEESYSRAVPMQEWKKEVAEMILAE